MLPPGRPPFLAAWLSAWLAAGAPAAAAAAEARKGCPDHLREIKRLYSARDPALLTTDILEPGCTTRELYMAAYYQGFGFYFVGRYRDALADLELARSLGGPWDEQILEYIWIIQGKLGESEAQTRTLEEFREDFPESRKLAGMETAERRAMKTSFDGLVTGGASWRAGEKSYQGARSQSLAGGSWTQSRGGRSLSEYLNLSGGLSLEGRDQRHYGLEGGLLFHGRSHSVQAEVGRLKSIYPALAGDSTVRRDSAGGTAPADTFRVRLRNAWEWTWSGNLARFFKRPGGWTWTANLNHFVLGRTFWSAGFTWEMDRRVGLRTVSLEATAEVQDFGESGYVFVEQGNPRFGPDRYAAFEAVWEGGRTTGRHILGAEVMARHESGLDADAWRTLATGKLSHALRLSPGVKLTHVLDLGWDWRRDRSAALEHEPVLAVRGSLAWFF